MLLVALLLSLLAALAPTLPASAREPLPAPAAASPAPKPPPVTTPPTAPSGVELYARYEGQKVCSPQAKPGAVTLRDWTVATYGGRAGGISRACGGSISEHKEGRAFDWTVRAGKKADRQRVQRWMNQLFATGPTGERHELARRMGVMYIIWNDRMYASYREFQPTKYVSSSCRGKKLRRCSPTLRHRDHVHVSLSWHGGRAQTSWYATPQARRFR